MLKVDPRIVSEKDDNMLSTVMLKLENENSEITSDENSSGSETE